MDVIMD